MPTSLGQYFNGVADLIHSRSTIASDSSQRGDIGTNREVICRDFFKKHIPARFSVNTGGDIFGLGDARSGQIDVIIGHDMSMNFTENDRIRCPVESVTAAISVKTSLDKHSLFDALSNLASVPQGSEEVVNLSPLGKKKSDYLLTWPAGIVFAYDGVRVETCLDHVATFYAENPVPFNRIPRAIVVNRKYLLTVCQYSVPNATTATPFDRSQVRGATMLDGTRGSPLMWIMNEISKGLTWLDGMWLDYEPYYNEAF